MLTKIGAYLVIFMVIGLGLLLLKELYLPILGIMFVIGFWLAVPKINRPRPEVVVHLNWTKIIKEEADNTRTGLFLLITSVTLFLIYAYVST